MMGKATKKKGTTNDPMLTALCVKDCGGSVMAWVCMDA